jgi:tetratricopeptide (TPR) repeat protein
MNDLASIAYAECMYGCVFMLLGDSQNTVELGRNAVRHSEEAQLLSLVGSAWNCLGYGYRYLGDAKAALNCLQKAVQSMEASGFTGSLPMIYSNLGEMYCDAGDMENARKFAEKALQLVQKDPDGFLGGYIRTYSGWVLGKSDSSRFAEAEKHVLLGLEILGKTEGKPYYAYGLTCLGELYADAGEKDKALASLRRALRMSKEMGMGGYWLARTEKALEKLKGQ